MKQNKQFLAAGGLALGLIGLIGCDEMKFQSTLTVEQVMKIVKVPEKTSCDDQYDWWNCSTEPVELLLTPGSYQAQASISNTQKTTKLKIVARSLDGKELVAEIESQRKLSGGDGTFSLQPSEINQEFGITGSLNTHYQDGEMQSDNESCTYFTRELICREVRDKGGTEEPGKPRIGKDRDRVVCKYEDIKHWGRQYVEFFYRYTTKTLTLAFVKEQALLAQSGGVWNATDKIYTMKTECR